MARTTLRDLMGLSDQPAALRETTLIMIDCQNTYRQGIMQLEAAEAALAEAARLLARARAADIPIFHIMHDAGEGLNGWTRACPDVTSPTRAGSWTGCPTRLFARYVRDQQDVARLRERFASWPRNATPE